MPTAKTDALAALRHPFVRAFAIGRIGASCAGQVISATVGWQLFHRTGDPFALGLTGLVEVLPVIVLFLPAGNAADRFPRKRVAALAYLLLALTSLGLALIAATDAPTPAIYALLLLVGVTRAYAAPAMSTILPQLLTPQEFANANAWLSASYQTASALGPALAGLLVAATGTATLAYLVATALIVVFLVMLTRVPTVAPPPETRRIKRTRADVLAGFTFIRGQPIFLAAITLDLFAVLFGGAVALIPMFADVILHTDAAGYGWLRASPALGALSMALLQTRLPPWRTPGKALLWTVLGFGVASIGFGLSRDFALSFVLLFIGGVFDEVSVVIRTTLEQVITPDGLRGRVAAVNSIFVGFSNELGAFESGLAATLVGPVAAVVAGGALTLAVIAVVARKWPELARVGPLHTLSPLAREVTIAAPAEPPGAVP